MTIAEAIRILEQSCPKRPQKLWSIKRKEAVKMAIEALNLDVVRCKDCKHRKEYNGQYHRCSVFERTVKNDDYCSFGERGEQDD